MAVNKLLEYIKEDNVEGFFEESLKLLSWKDFLSAIDQVYKYFSFKIYDRIIKDGFHFNSKKNLKIFDSSSWIGNTDFFGKEYEYTDGGFGNIYK